MVHTAPSLPITTIVISKPLTHGHYQHRRHRHHRPTIASSSRNPGTICRHSHLAITATLSPPSLAHKLNVFRYFVSRISVDLQRKPFHIVAHVSQTRRLWPRSELVWRDHGACDGQDQGCASPVIPRDPATRQVKCLGAVCGMPTCAGLASRASPTARAPVATAGPPFPGAHGRASAIWTGGGQGVPGHSWLHRARSPSQGQVA